MAETRVEGEARQVAEYWDRIAPEFDAIYTGNKNAISRRLDRWLRRDMYQRFDWVMRKAGDLRGKTVCDVGCGSGRFVTALARRGGCVTGLDFAPKMLDLARQLVQHEQVAEQCNFVLSDVLDWKTKEQFDLVIAIGFWDYVADPLGRLQVIRGITKGRFLSAWPRAGTWRAAIRKQRLKVSGCPVYFWTSSQIEDYLRRAQFRIVSSEIYGQLDCVESVPE
jgi:ubiquinone/menaquinone biosynthesis C-methylase UbiE